MSENTSAAPTTPTSDYFKTFLSELDTHTDEINSESESLQNELRSTVEKLTGEETALEQRIDEEKSQFYAEKCRLEKELEKLETLDGSLATKQREWEDKLEAANEELMLKLDDEDTFQTEKNFGDLLSSLLKSLNNMSFQSMNSQSVELEKTLRKLCTEQDELSKSIKSQEKLMQDLNVMLKSSYGVNYKERNVLRISLMCRVSKVRQEYQKTRLMEESLKAKLSV